MRIVLTTAFVAALLPPTLAANPTADACPKAITDAQEYVSGASEGWSAFGSRQEHPLQGVSFYSGSPDKKALLAPTAEHLGGKAPRAEWALPETQEPYWVACEYAQTTVIVARPLPAGTRSCTVKYVPHFSSPVASSWQCKAG
ncbi:STY0301 family protein [Niveibacterium sp. SC-1]|uniref:STY0301 family protein n=1 Tax=Niveibacterium sp. SC-1 TaxID=3135646 RepID=UPI00311EEF99